MTTVSWQRVTADANGRSEAESESGGLEGRLLVALVVLSALARSQQYLARRSLWTDEAMLAVNIPLRSPLELLQPLHYDQLAPPLFLWIQRLAVAAGGVSEFSLRAVPFIAGLLLPLLVWRLGRRLLGARTALIATAIAGFAPALIFYANDAKPYGLDAVVAVLLVMAAARLLAGHDRRTFWTLLAAGAAGVWLSATAVFVLAGILAAMLVSLARTRQGEWHRLAALATAWGVSFLLVHGLVYVRASRNDYMQEFWQGTYLRAGSLEALLESAILVLRTFLGIFLGSGSVLEAIGGQGGVLLFLLIAVTGPMLIGIARVQREQGPVTLMLLLGPFLAMVAASAIGAYPMAARLALFQAPFWALLIAHGIGWLGLRVPGYGRGPAFLALGAMLPVAGLPAGGRWSLREEQWSNARELVEIERRENRGAEPVYVNARGIPIYAFYTTRWSRPDTQRLHALISLTESKGPAFENASGRVSGADLEASSLVVQGRRPELIGLPTGMQLRSRAGFSQLAAYPGWLEHEVQRIRQAARPRIWLYFFSAIDNAHVPIVETLSRQGGRQLREERRMHARLYLFEFDHEN